MIIAIDGPAASGKSTTAKQVAQKLGFLHLDTGAMYRAVTLHFIRCGVDIQSEQAVSDKLSGIDIELTSNGRVLLNGEDVSLEIRSDAVSRQVSPVSAVGIVRDDLVARQRHLAERNDVVMEGRDIGTRVFPDADFKFFITADVRERGHRRFIEQKERGGNEQLEDVIKKLAERDRYDSSRKHSPLKKAPDAVEIDTTQLTIAEQVSKIIDFVNTKQ